MGMERSRVIQKKIDDLVVQLAVACEMMDCADCDMVGGMDGPGCLVGNPKWIEKAILREPVQILHQFKMEAPTFKEVADETRHAIVGDVEFFLLPFQEQVGETHELRMKHDELLWEMEEKGRPMSKDADKRAIIEYWQEAIEDYENAGDLGDAEHARKCLEIDLRNIENGEPLLNPQALSD